MRLAPTSPYKPYLMAFWFPATELGARSEGRLPGRAGLGHRAMGLPDCRRTTGPPAATCLRHLLPGTIRQVKGSTQNLVTLPSPQVGALDQKGGSDPPPAFTLKAQSLLCRLMEESPSPSPGGGSCRSSARRSTSTRCSERGPARCSAPSTASASICQGEV